MTTSKGLLDQRDCWRLLRTIEVGRLCYTEAAMPVIRAMPFVVDGPSVVVALSLAAVVPGTFTRPSVVAFEAGEWTPHERRGWSVQLVGQAKVVSDQESAVLAQLGLTSWIDGEPALYVRVSAAVLSGTQAE